MVREIVTRKRLLIVSPMGSGKTLASLFAMAKLTLSGEARNILVIAPLRVASSVWQQENEKYGIGLNVRYCKTALDIKLFLLSPGTHVCVASVSRIEEIPHKCWDAVFLDESTLYGNKSSKRSKEARRICNRVPYRVLLTGTPIHGGYEKLFHQMFLVDGGEALGRTLTSFLASFMRVKFKLNAVVSVYEIDPFHISTIMERIKPSVLILKDVVKLPPLFVKNIYVDLPKVRLEEYKQFQKDSIIAFKAETGSDPLNSEKALIAFSKTTMGMKLRQLASGAVYTNDPTERWSPPTKMNGVYSVTHRAKMDCVKEIYEAAGRGVMVVYQFKSELEELRKTFPEAKTLDSEAEIAAWNAGKIPMILVHPASAGWGLNLQFGGNIIVWFSLTYDAELYAQLNKRLYRSGQTESVSLVHIIAKGTIDERILLVLINKEKTAKEFNNGI